MSTLGPIKRSLRLSTLRTVGAFTVYSALVRVAHGSAEGKRVIRPSHERLYSIEWSQRPHYTFFPSWVPLVSEHQHFRVVSFSHRQSSPAAAFGGWSDWLKAFIINLLYTKSCHLANLLILAFLLNTYDFKRLVSIILLNKLPFVGFGNTAISAKCLQTKIIAFIKPLIICYLPILPILAFLVNSYYQFCYIFSKS